MRRNPQKRLGASERDAEDVKRQSFFRVKPDVNEFIAMLKCIYCSFFFLPSFEVFFFFFGWICFSLHACCQFLARWLFIHITYCCVAVFTYHLCTVYGWPCCWTCFLFVVSVVSHCFLGYRLGLLPKCQRFLTRAETKELGSRFQNGFHLFLFFFF